MGKSLFLIFFVVSINIIYKAKYVFIAQPAGQPTTVVIQQPAVYGAGFYGKNPQPLNWYVKSL